MAEEIGSAYLTIKPKISDSFESEVESGGKSSGGKFGGAFAVAAGNLISNAVSSIASAAADVFSNALGNYAEYEQLVGGIDTLFKDSSDTVQKYAEEAYKNAGMSANEYMGNVTDFSAALISSLGGDTAAAAELANTAMVGISDNANKMGTDIESIVATYQSLARGNYAMLDNLKLGFGGTKAELERLIKEASQMTDVQEELGMTVDESSMSFDNIVKAIQVMQTSMGIAGATEAEAMGTISGSMQMFQAAWQNFLTALGDSDADLSARAQELVDSFMAVVENIAPRLLVFAENLFAAIPTLIEKMQPYIEQFMTMFGEFIAQYQPEIEAAGATLFDGIKSALSVVLEAVIKALGEFITELIVTFPEWYPAIQEAAFDLFMAIVKGFVLGIKPFFENLEESMNEAIEAIGGFFGDFLEAGGEIVGNIAEGIGNAIDGVKEAIGNVIDAITSPLRTAQETVAGIAETIAGAFNFEWSLPELKLPHIVVGSYIDVPVLGTIPDPTQMWVEWYGSGGIVDGATLIGAGERGAELMWPSYEPYFDKYARGIAEHMPARAGVDIHDCTFNVRKDSDIRAVAAELNILINRQAAGVYA